VAVAKLDRGSAILLARVALVAGHSQQLLWVVLAVSVPADALCMCTERDGQSAQRTLRDGQSPLTSGIPVRRVLTGDIAMSAGSQAVPQRADRAGSTCGCARRARVLFSRERFLEGGVVRGCGSRMGMGDYGTELIDTCGLLCWVFNCPDLVSNGTAHGRRCRAGARVSRAALAGPRRMRLFVKE
jgi:hypothetical protein